MTRAHVPVDAGTVVHGLVSARIGGRAQVFTRWRPKTGSRAAAGFLFHAAPRSALRVMKKALTLLVPLVVFVAGAFVLPGETVTFHVAPKTKLAKTFASSMKLESKHISIEVDGEDQSDQVAGMHVATEDTAEIEIVDDYASVADGRPTKFTRQFAKLAGESRQTITFPGAEAGDAAPTETNARKSALEGKHVRFTWDEDDSEYTRAWGGEDTGDEALYEHARGDMDCLVLLPAKAVADGDTWEVEAKLMNSILAPGGDLELRTGDEDDADGELDFERALEENLTGKVRATFKGVRDEGGVRVAVIEFQADLEAHGELDADGDKQSVTSQMKIEGTLLWNLKAGHFHALELRGSLAAVYASHATVDGDDGEALVETTIAFEGEIALTARTNE